MTASRFLAGAAVSRLGRLFGWKQGQLARNTVLATFWQGVRLALQVAYLVLVARILGADGYGRFAGIVALAASLSALAGGGFGLVMVKQVSRRPETFRTYWGRTLTAIMLSAPLLILVMVVAALVLLPADSTGAAVLLVASAELILVPIVSAASNAYQAHERLGASILNFVLLNCGRLAAMAGLALSGGKPDLTAFAVVYLVGTAIPALGSLFAVSRSFGRPLWRMRGMTREWREGIGFSLSGVAVVAHGELDKALLLRLGGALNAGNYSVATRAVSAASVPVVAYVLSVAPRLFRAGEHGVGSGAVAAVNLLRPVLAYGALAGAAIFVLAPLLLPLLGDDFAGSIPIVRMLAVLPFLVGVSSLLLAVLTCSGAQRMRVSIEAAALSLNVVANITLIPVLGTLGAVISILTSQVVLAALAAAVIYLSLRDRFSK